MTDPDPVVDRVARAVAETAPEVRDGLLDHRDRSVDEDHPTGDTMIDADVFADRLFLDRLRDIEGIGEYASEDRNRPLDTGGGLAVSVDPLDGSSNVASNNLVGTIVGVYDEALPAPGRSLVGAMYVVYGPIITMVVATAAGVTEYAVTDDGRETLTADVSLPEEPTVYGVGGRVTSWTSGFAAFVDELERELKLRYGGAMVGDVNQVLTYGGIFSYPALRDRPEGKLRLQFESAPVGYVIEAAGGRASTGTDSILEVDPVHLHQRIPTHLGNGALIDRLESRLEG